MELVEIAGAMALGFVAGMMGGLVGVAATARAGSPPNL